MKNKIEDLRNHLFETIEMLKEGDIEIDKAKAITDTAQAIINSAKVEADFLKSVGGIGTGTGFIPLDNKQDDKGIYKRAIGDGG